MGLFRDYERIVKVGNVDAMLLAIVLVFWILSRFIYIRVVR